ncbi:response regulator [Pseudomonas sp. NCHU5208]|uniref:response regulator n=1 Tax=unclassified Pseudomonas TaxID=196821 RepID=UPI003F96AFF7
MSNEDQLRVMIVDDSQTIRNAGENYLTAAGCTVHLAEDGFDCIARVKDFDPQFFFIDVMMPRLDGYQATQLIRNHERYRDTPIVFLSSKDGLFDKAKGEAAGATEYLTKPFKREDLVDAVKRLVPGFNPHS